MLSNRANTRMSMAMPDSWLKAAGKLNVPLYRLSRGRLMGKVGTASGAAAYLHRPALGPTAHAPVLYLKDGERLVVVGSNAGNDRAPAWSFNLKANPDAEVDVRGKRSLVRARVAEGEERTSCGRRSTSFTRALTPTTRTPRATIAVFVLEPR